MGRLRLEPIKKKAMNEARYEELLDVLRKAQNVASDHQVFYDLGSDEKSAKVRKEFLHVAQQEGVDVRIRQVRKTHSLSFLFGGAKKERTRMSAEEAKKRILTALVAAEKPLRKSEIVNNSGVSASTWNLRISELLSDGSVKREGDRRDSVYVLA